MIYSSDLMEARVRKRLMMLSYDKLSTARKSPVDPIRRTLLVLSVIKEANECDARFLPECSALIQTPRVVVVLQRAPPQRVELSSPCPPPPSSPVSSSSPYPCSQESLLSDTCDPSFLDANNNSGDDDTGSSLARKRKVIPVDTAGSEKRHCD